MDDDHDPARPRPRLRAVGRLVTPETRLDRRSADRPPQERLRDLFELRVLAETEGEVDRAFLESMEQPLLGESRISAHRSDRGDLLESIEA